MDTEADSVRLLYGSNGQRYTAGCLTSAQTVPPHITED